METPDRETLGTISDQQLTKFVAIPRRPRPRSKASINRPFRPSIKPVIGSALPSTLPADHWQALKTAGNILIDEFSDDVGRLLAGEEFDDSLWMSNYLPPQFHPRYTPLLAKKLLVCVVLVAWKLEQPDGWLLACVGEHLALRALIERAEVELELQGKEADYSSFWDLSFEDADIEMLFNPAWDGIEDSEIGDHLGVQNLEVERWFDPLYDIAPVHPYVAEEP